ncbi:ataxin-1a [Denticeps clupeoides]|uniref:AXH domain-containing protein n=1 Tax=Denticeps clupeoides TaxID=299321 RepID=A0AAY4EXR4_9TELE|nr:ataxin-1 [Denticeps clupeoides]XP_028819387.1 ataxin-1 [Denticeps clupeoides]XP_028819388.1 ataxin-1 [Denticeps clupeoides]XP_028819389.1 ataxin-1 [Denticeps clupeoides]
MKSNQERSNECLPPKKREIPASTLPSEERPLVVAPASESQRNENLAWLASVASGHDTREQRPSIDADGPLYKPTNPEYSLPSSSSSRASLAVTTLPALYTSPLSQPGAIQYTPIQHSLHFITNPYTSPYPGYIPSPLPPPPSGTTSTSTSSAHRSHMEAYANSPASKLDQHHHAPQLAARSSGLTVSESIHHSAQYVQITGSAVNITPRTVSSPHGHQPLHLHPSPVLVQYADMVPTPKKEDGRPRDLVNGELEKGRRFGSDSSTGKLSGAKSASTQQHQVNQQQTSHPFEGQVLHTEYTHDSGLHSSLLLVPNNLGSGATATEPGHSLDKLVPAAPSTDKGGICVGKPMSRTPSTSSSSLATLSQPFLPPPSVVDSMKAPQTVIQTPNNTNEALPISLASANFYPAQQSIIGYIAAGGGQQQPLGYHPAALPQHLVIPGTQPVIIPVTGTSVTGAEVTHAPVTATSTSPFVTPFAHPGTVVEAQLHLPLIPAPTGLLATPHAPPPQPPAAPSLPPYFAKGSIIQLANGELKRVEELKTEDFIQSAEISSDLKIDSSTVERIEDSHTSNFAIIQFAVGEHRAQVSVEVLVEYPFFVFGQGWSSCCPDRTTQLLELPCTKLSVGDVCISLTLKNLKNGSLKKSQGQAQESQSPTAPVLPLKPPKVTSAGTRGGRNVGTENGLGQQGPKGGQANPENGELKLEEREPFKAQPPTDSESSCSRPSGGRKRRWSAPEGRKVEKADEEPPLTLPKPSFIPQEVKISIEGRSNIGK